MKKLFLFSLCCLLVIAANGQTQTGFEKFLKDFKVSKSFGTTDDQAKPATLSLTKPTDTAASYLIDLALKHNIAGQFDANAELHLNSLVRSKQKNYSFGISYQIETGQGFPAAKSTPWITINGQFNRDEVLNTGAFTCDANFTMLFTTTGAPNQYNDFGSFLAMEYDLSAGVQYQNTFSADKESLKGTAVRPYGIFNLMLYPFNKFFNGKLDLFSNLTYRYDVVHTNNDLTPKSHPQWSSGADYSILKAKTNSVQLSFAYNAGDDPMQALKGQRYYLLALKFKFI